MRNDNRMLAEKLGRKFHYYKEVDSTNNVAKKMNVWEHGTVVIAEIQTAGRGTYGRTFHSKAGSGIYMSLILDVKKWQLKKEHLATIYTAVAVCEAIEEVTGTSPDVKWVNDLFVNRRKIGGILTEKEISSNKLVIGIGINLTGKEEDFPEEIKGIAGSLGLKEPVSDQGVAIAMKIYDKIISSEDLIDENVILNKYKARLFILGQTVDVTQGNNNFEAKVVDVDKEGRLIVLREEKELALSAGEVKINV